jgi:hypothetical protein
MNDLPLNIKLEEDKKRTACRKTAASDRAPTIEEILKSTKYPDRRIKPIVCIMISSGMRIGAWDYPKWKHVTPLIDDDGEVIAAKLIVYAGEPEQYYSFITPGAYRSLKEWMEFRHSYVEEISKESWLMRDLLVPTKNY